MPRFLFWIVKDYSMADVKSAIESLRIEKRLRIAPSVPGLPSGFDISAGFNEVSRLLTLYVGDCTGLNLAMFKQFASGDREYYELCYFDRENYWVCNLGRGGQTTDRFSTLPDIDEMFADCDKLRGDAAGVSRALGIGLDRVEKYFRWWRTPQDLHGWSEEDEEAYWETLELSTGKALEPDEFEYGDGRQVFDFARAIGGLWPPTDDGRWIQYSVPKS
jgi:hypothetical protein